MAVLVRGLQKCFQTTRNVLPPLLDGTPYTLQIIRTGYFGSKTEHDTEYEYEVSKDPNEWKYVERLIPMRIVPPVSEKKEYPSGWRPQTEEAFKHNYYVPRTKNHMLPVYLRIEDRGILKYTIIRHIRGDIWSFYNELTAHLQGIFQKKILGQVLEANGQVKFKGDKVYYCEQWLLSKGF